MKKSFLLILVAILLPITASADDGKVLIDGIYYFLSDHTATVTSGDSDYAGDIIIPESVSYNGASYKVTEIGYSAFYSRLLTSVVIPNSVTTISSWAFGYSDNLKSISLPDSLTYIGEYCFNGSGITSITLPPSLKRIEKRAFAYCNNLKKVVYDCKSLQTADFSYTHITSFELGENAEGICPGFPYNTVQTITVNPLNKRYDSRNDCNAIIETETNKLIVGCPNTVIPENVTSIDNYAFGNCVGVTSIHLPDGLISIGDYAFYKCSELTTINLPDGLMSIGTLAFGETGLTSVTIPQSVEDVEFNAFYGCPWYKEQPDGPVYLGRVVDCKNPGNLDPNSEIVIKEGIKRIPKDAFQGCLTKSLRLPESLEVIGDNAFAFAELDTLCIPDNVHTIGDMAFCSSKLKKVSLPKSLTEIGVTVFYECEQLTSVTFPEGMSIIGYAMFEGCTSLKSITIPNTVTTVGEAAFEDCKSLESATIGNAISSISDRMFNGCTSLRSVNIPNGVTLIKGSAFSGCESLDSISIPNSVDSIGSYSFGKCKSLRVVRFSRETDSFDNSTIIGPSAFQSCVSLTSVTLPEYITSIQRCAFANCDSLKSVTILGDITNFGYGVFHNCTNIREFTYLSSTPCWVSSVIEYGYYFMPSDVFNNATLYVPMQFIDIYKNTHPWYKFKQIVGLTDKTVELKCMAGDQDVTSDVTIEWSNSKGDRIGNGTSIGCFNGQQLYFSVLLNENLGRVYHEIVDEPFLVDGDSKIVCQLKKIERVQLLGRVSAEDIAEKTANVHVKQMLNGKYEETSNTQSNSKGEFSLEGYDDDTEIIISCDGYMDAVVHHSSLNGNGDFGVITLKPISGFVIPVNIEYTTVASEDDNVIGNLMPGGLYDLQLALTNESTGNDITDFSVQYNGTIIIKSGANSWEDISITAKSKAGVFAETSTTFHIDDDVTNSIDLNFIELGGISSTFSGSNNSNNVGYLYNDKGFLVARGVYNGETLKLRHLPQGTYTLVSIGQSALLSNISELSRLSELNLVAGKDYLTTQVEVEDGRTTTVSTGSIPKLNESLFLFDGSLLADKSSVVIGNYVTLYTTVNINEDLYDKVNDVYLTFDIPEGCQLVKNSVLVNRAAQTYTLNGNTLNLHLTKDQTMEEILFCIIPVEAKICRSTAYVSLDKEITSPRLLGVAQFESEELTFRAPSTTPKTSIVFSGITNPNSEVKVYDGDVQIGKTTANGDGSWMTECELYNAYNLSYHDILVKANTQEGLTLTSSVKSVLYDRACIVPSSVSMTFYNGWHRDNITVDFDLINGTTSAKHYDFYTETDFTFLAKFTRNDTTIIKDVSFMVKASDGTIRILPALFDSKQQAWVATSKYDSDKLPQNVTVDYICTREESDDEREESFLYLAKQLSSVANHINNFISENTEMTLIEDEEDHTLLACNFDGMDSPLNYRIELLYYEDVEKMMGEKQFLYSWDDEGCMGYYTEMYVDSVVVVAADLEAEVAFRMTLYDPYAVSNAKANKAPRMKISITQWLKNVGNYLKKDFNQWKSGGGLGGFVDLLGGIEYLLTKRDYDNMAKRLARYLDKFSEAENKTVNLIAAMCPDGSYRLSKNERDRYFKRASELNRQTALFDASYEEYLVLYQCALGWNVFYNSLFSIACMPIGGVVKTVGQAEMKYIPKMFSGIAKNKLVKNVTASEAAKKITGLAKRMVKHKTLTTEQKKNVENALGSLTKTVFTSAATPNIFKSGNYRAVQDELISWASEQSKWILDYHKSMDKEIISHYSSCKKYDLETHEVTDPWQETFVENKDDNTINFTTPSVEPILDPSGYVYEAVLSNRLPGVTTTVYQKKNGSAVKWNAEDYSQENPLVTDEAGFYRWDVPQGEWQVKYEKDGYETCYSEWLPVPPPQLDVNVGMKQTTPPAVKLMRGAESGITIEMSKYMLPESLNEKSVVVKMDGATRNGHLEMLNTEESPAGEKTYVSKVKFVPEDPFVAGDEVDVTVKGSVESYCSVQMGSDHTEKVRIEPEITAIIIDSVLTVPYQGTKTVQVLVMPQEVSAGKTLNARLSSSLITSLDNERIVVDENGLATLTLNGDLPGAAQLMLTMDKVDITAESMVRVDVEYEVVNTPTASIRNGEQVGKGTQLSLSCATEGATIYYTLDGSCPCNEDTRILYTGPFELPEGVVTVKVMAEAEYLYDSDVATFVYQVNSSTGINKPTTEGHRFTAAYANGYIVIDGAEGADCKIYDMAGRELAGKQGLGAHDAVQVQKADTYVISIKHADGKMAVKKIMRR